MMISLVFSRVAGVWKMNRKEITECRKLCLFLHVSFYTWLIAVKCKCRLSEHPAGALTQRHLHKAALHLYSMQQP